MMANRRRLLQAAAAGAGTLALPTLARAAAPTLKVWINGDKGWHGLSHACAAFERDTGIAVQVEHPEDAISKFEQAAAAGKGPDVWIWPHDRLGGWSSSGLIAPVTPSAATRAAIDDQAWSAWQLKGATWGWAWRRWRCFTTRSWCQPRRRAGTTCWRSTSGCPRRASTRSAGG